MPVFISGVIKPESGMDGQLRPIQMMWLLIHFLIHVNKKRKKGPWNHRANERSCGRKAQPRDFINMSCVPEHMAFIYWTVRTFITTFMPSLEALRPGVKTIRRSEIGWEVPQCCCQDACWISERAMTTHMTHMTKHILWHRDSWNLTLTHWGRDKMAAIFQTTFSNRFSWMEMYEFRFEFHWCSFLGAQLTKFQHWFR